MASKSLDEIKKLRKQLVEQITIVLNHAKIIFGDKGKGTYEVLAEKMEHIEKEDFYILVVGEFKRGKSTLINALLGDKILPTKVAPCTGLITEVKYGKEKKAELYRHKVEEPLAVAPENIRQYIEIKEQEGQEEDSEITHTEYERIVLYYPLPLCEQNITIVDSPGLNEDTSREEMVRHYLPKIDAAIMVLGCDQFLSQTEQAYLKDDIAAYVRKHLFVVANRCDDLEPEDKKAIVQRAKQHLQEFLPQPWESRFFMVSAKQVLQARGKKAPSPWEESFQAFEKALADYLIHERAKAKLETPALIVSKIINDIQQQHLPKWESLFATPLKELDERLRKAQQPVQALQDTKQEMVANIVLECENFISKLPGKIDSFCDALPTRLQESNQWQQVRLEHFKLWKMNVEETLKQDIMPVMETYLKQQSTEFIKGLQKELEDSLQTIRKNFERCAVNFDNQLQELKRILYNKLEETDHVYRHGVLAAPVFTQRPIWEELFKKIMPHGALVGVAILVGITSPYLLVPAVVGLAIWQAVTGDSLERLLKQKTLDEFNKKRPDIKSQIRNKLGEDIRKLYDQVADAIGRQLQGLIDDEVGKVRKVQEERKQHEESIEQKRRQSAQIRKELARVDQEIERIISSF